MDQMRIISFGGGVQTVALAVLTVQRIIPSWMRATHAVFADTGGEVPETYACLEMLAPWLEKERVPLAIVSAGNLYDYCLERRILPVAFGQGKTRRRFCTEKFKVRVVNRWLRSQGCKRATVQLGISWDEIQRMGSSKRKWVTNEFPLIDLGLNREDCHEVLRRAGLPEPVKSACFFCPMQDGARWRRLSDRHPDLFELAVQMEEAACARRVELGKKPLYLSYGRRPLREFVLAMDGVAGLDEGECSGYCFV
jgi:hypothetical protein